MAHPLEANVREAYVAFARGDLDAYLRHCTRDFCFNVPGRSAVSGTFRDHGGDSAVSRAPVTPGAI